MKLKLIRHLWGVDLTKGLYNYLPHWREVGYEAVEIALNLVPDQKAFLRFLEDSRLGWVPQVFSNDFTPGGSVGMHFDSLRTQIEKCLNHHPLFFNAHSGADTWSQAETIEFYGRVLDLEQKIGVPISHETHRLRPFGIPWQMRPILEAFPDLLVTCDFSHWVCVCERLLPDLGETISLAARHCHHLHSRVGFEEGPQVPDPAAPEYALHLAAHESWWDAVWEAQRARGLDVTTLTPEFGPAPYMHTVPYTKAPLADLTKICDWMAERQKSRFASIVG